MLTLDKIPDHTQVRIVSIQGDKVVRRRLMDFGLLPRATVLVRKKAPLGDPIEISIKQTELTLRKNDAAHIIVEPIA